MTSELNPEFPLRIGPPEKLAQVESALRAAAFQEAVICRALKISALAQLGSLKRNQIQFDEISGPLALFIKIFLFGETVPRAEIEGILDESTLNAFLMLDLLRFGNFAEECCYSAVFLYPVGEFIVASDRHTNADGSPFAPPTDVVFPAIFTGTLRFLHLISKSPVGDALDLCAGSGIGALTLSRHVQRAVSADITARASHFAEFNRWLNRCSNVEVVRGDLYGAVEGRTFDRIIGHPPYVPSLGDAMIFRDGGEAGETVLRRMVEGLPQYLRPAGTFYALGIGLDTKEGRFEERARGWLGTGQDEFDIIFASGDEKPPEFAVRDIAERAKEIASVQPERLLEVYRNMGVLCLAYGALCIHRHAGTGLKPWTLRPKLSLETDGASFEWLLAWQQTSARSGFFEWLSQAQPRLAPWLEVKSTHLVREGTLVPAEFLLQTEKPFAATTRFDLWVIPLIAKFNGQLRVAEVHQAASAAGEVPDNFGLSDFARLVALLIERGYLVLDDLKPENS